MKKLKDIAGYVLGGVMFVQVLSEEKRLRRDFGEEYEAYCKHTGRFLQ